MRIILFFFSFLLSLFSFSQVRYKFKQYMVHPILYNPGFIDKETKYSINSLYRRQWLRQENYPEVFFIYGHYNFGSKRYTEDILKHGVSMTISNDLVNNYNQFEISAAYICDVPLNKKYTLGLGIKAGFDEQNLLNTNLTYFDPEEPLLDGNFTNHYVNLGAGISLKSKTFNANLSLPYLFGNNFLSPHKNYSLKSNHLYASIGYKKRFSDWFIMYPSTMIYIVGGSKFHGSFNLNFLSEQLIWFGLGMDTEFTVNASLGLFLMSGFRIVYVIDNRFFPANQTTGFSHEISLSYAKSIKDNPFRRKKLSRLRG